MLQTSARLLRLVTVMQGRRTWTGPELAERLEVTARTLRRDVDRLRSLGYPVHSTSGTAGGYSLGAGASLPPLMLDDAEGVAVAVALTMAAGSSVEAIEGSATRALSKLEQVLPAKLQRKVKALRSSIVRLAERGPKVSLGLVAELADACEAQVQLGFRYQDREGAATKRETEPLRLVHMDRRWYLLAWDRTKKDWRTFRVDRISPPLVLGDRFTPRPAPEDDVAGFVKRAVSTNSYKFKGRVILDVPFAEARKKISPNWGVLEEVDATHCRFSTGAASYEALAMWISMLDFPFRVEEPAPLVDAMKAMAARLTRAAKR